MDLNNHKSRKVANWLYLGVALTIVQIALGGITRLTGSGLSITEWDVVTGTLPPMNEAAWMELFNKYKATPQFQLLNFDFNLSNFKFIFFWEWFHRFWARGIGLVFAFGFVYFFVKKYFQPKMVKPLLILFFLGAMQGGIGWIMVASGLEGDAVYVKPTRLALHFIFALGLLSYTYWFALSLTVTPLLGLQNFKRSMEDKDYAKRFANIKKGTYIICVILFFQLIYGALMAGHKAASAASTWPTINGEWIPTHLMGEEGFFLNAIDNTTWIHFVHRGLAYILLVILYFWNAQLLKVKGNTFWSRIRLLPLFLVLLQATLGIMSLWFSTGIIPGVWGKFEWFAQIHQFVGMLFLLSMVNVIYMTHKQEAVS
jgi:cytochrome c oxidase assembly protein subunit 15